MEPADMASFGAQLDILARDWAFLSPEDFEGVMRGVRPLDRDSLAITFDDGYQSQLHAAREVLNPRGLRAIFFVISEYVSIPGDGDWRAFVSANIWPGRSSELIPGHWQNMSRKDLLQLIDMGHTIGCHSLRHARCATLPPNELADNLVVAADEIAALINQPVEHFAYPFGDVGSFSETALAVARDRFEFIHTGIRGVNSEATFPWAVFRDSFEPCDSINWQGAVLNGITDWKYRDARSQFLQWGMG